MPTRQIEDMWKINGVLYESKIVRAMNARWKITNYKAKIIELSLNYFTLVPEYNIYAKNPPLNTKYRVGIPKAAKAGKIELHKQFMVHSLNS